jgi:hypothetical protein
MNTFKTIFLLFVIFYSDVESFGQVKKEIAKSEEASKIFNELKVDSLYKNEKHSIDYNSNSTARRFKTVITNAYKKEGLNFGGHYCFVYWGCGSPCKASAIVDLSTGKVYDAPAASIGYDYRMDSRILIVNPKDTTGFFVDCAYCNQEVWILNEQTKKFHKK